MTIKVLLVDDEELVRFGLRTVLEAAGDFTIVGEASNGLAGLHAVHELRPDVVLMDIRMPGMDGLEATRRITGTDGLEHTRIIVLTTFERDEYVFDALRMGASGFLLKDTPPEQLLQAITTVAEGGALLAPAATRALIREFVEKGPRRTVPHPRLGQLTDREREVVSLAAEGLDNAEIAERLAISEHTVKSHVGNILAKLQLADRTQAAVYAWRQGIVRRE